MQILVLYITTLYTLAYLQLCFPTEIQSHCDVYYIVCVFYSSPLLLYYTCELVPRHSNISRFLKAGVVGDSQVLYTQMDRND